MVLLRKIFGFIFEFLFALNAIFAALYTVLLVIYVLNQAIQPETNLLYGFLSHSGKAVTNLIMAYCFYFASHCVKNEKAPVAFTSFFKARYAHLAAATVVLMFLAGLFSFH